MAAPGAESAVYDCLGVACISWIQMWDCQEDCQARKLNKEDAMDRCKWRKVIKEVR